MREWVQQLRVDPLPCLVSSEDEALRYLVKRDLLGEEIEPIATLWQLPEVERIVKNQQGNGSWRYGSRKKAHRNENYDLLQTYRLLRGLVEQYGLNARHSTIPRAAEYVFAHQSSEGDIRGIFGAQYATHYTAGLVELLIKAGYSDDPRV